MTVGFQLPDVGEGIHEAEVVRWLVEVGDTVKEFEPLVEVQTDKALVELPAPTGGQVLEIRYQPGDLARVGDVLVVIGKGEERAESRSEAGGPEASAIGRVLATPSTRKRARELGVDIRKLRGSGPAGRVTRDDVERAVQAVRPLEVLPPAVATEPERPAGMEGKAAPSPSEGEQRIPLRGLRRAVAQKMVRSAFTAPHVTAFDEVDVTELIAVRREANSLLAGRGVKLTYLPFILKALAAALRKHPYLNAHMDEDRSEIVLKREAHIGIAVDTPDGLLVPVVRHVDRKSVLELAEEIRTLSERARSRTLDAEQLRGGTFTLSNMGPIGGQFATPILNHPEAALLGVHKIEERGVVHGGEIVIRSRMNVSLSFDHRVIDGAEAVRFINELKRLLEHPNLLFLEMSAAWS